MYILSGWLAFFDLDLEDKPDFKILLVTSSPAFIISFTCFSSINLFQPTSPISPTFGSIAISAFSKLY